MSPDEVIAVIEAHKAGKKIQWRSNGSALGDKWVDDNRSRTRFDFNFYSYDYRIKPEPPPPPREFWITVGGQVWQQEQYARDWFKDDAEFARRVIHVREVVEASV